MGTETTEWYNTQILVGFTDQRGTAWHYKASAQGAEPNHYKQAIPVEDVQRRLFAWNAIKEPVYTKRPNNNYDFDIVPNRQAILRDDTRHTFGVFTDSYQPHQYGEWLVKNLSNIIDDDLSIGSAGLLKGGGVAWVSLEMPESIKILQGFDVRPHLLATTSHNGVVATTYKKVATFVVCDNTYSEAMGENTNTFKARHSRYSGFRIQTARDALGIVHQMTDDIVGHILRLSEIKVDQRRFDMILAALIPIGQDSAKITVTRAEEKRALIRHLYNEDARVASWKGSALAVVQAFNTYNHHNAGTDKNRIERNVMGLISGAASQADRKVLQIVGSI